MKKRWSEQLPYYLFTRDGKAVRVPNEPLRKIHPPMVIPEWWYFDYARIEQHMKEAYDSLTSNTL